VTDDDDLRELLTDAVEDVEPAYRLDAIKARTSRPSRRRGWYAVGGAVLAAAAVVTAVSVVTDDDRPRREPPIAEGQRITAGLYFVGETPQGPRLYREFHQIEEGPLAAIRAITTAGGPQDPDYTTDWPKGSFERVEVTGNAIDVELGPEAPRLREVGRLGVQQVLYTLQAATREQLPVRFTEDGQTVDGVYERAPQNDVLAQVSISDPAEGLHVTESFVARGRANSFEANVPWEITDASGDVVMDGFVTAAGFGDHLYKWETDPIDVSQLEPGRYTFVASTDDPSGGAEGFGPFTDTRTIIVD
jgi:immunoglobulin-like protein involved in spore germination